MAESIACWLESSLRRVYTATQSANRTALSLAAARGEKCSFQVCFRNLTLVKLDARVSVTGPDDLDIRVRRVGYVFVRHHNTLTEPEQVEGVGHIPGYVPDPLFPEDTAEAGPMETHSFWITIRVPENAAPGPRELTVRLEVGEESIEPLSVMLAVSPVVLQKTRFPVTHWFYADAICDWYKLRPYEERAWDILRPYIADAVEHGSSSLYVPIFTPPTDGVKRPHQLLRVTTPFPGRYEFDFTDVKRWVDMGLECGAQYFEWTHFFSQWGAANALRIYRDNADPDSLLWPPETSATSDTYRIFLAQFLPEFLKFLESEDLLCRSFFHVSDEPHGEEHLANYRAARQMLRELAPWMRVMDALSEIEYGREGITDMPVPSIRVAQDYAKEGIPSWAYYCCGPRGAYLNRLMDTPLAKIRMHGFLFYRLGALGFLHWGYNYWYRSQTQELIDPFTEQSGGIWPNWAYGDPFVVYPGETGPLDSIRWEIFSEAIQDYALLETCSITPDDPMLAGITGYDAFPFTEEWISGVRNRLLA